MGTGEGRLVVRSFAGVFCITALNLSWEEGSAQSYGVEAWFIESPDSLHTKSAGGFCTSRCSPPRGVDGGVCAVQASFLRLITHVRGCY